MEIKTGMDARSQLVQAQEQERASRARELVDTARKVQSPRVLEAKSANAEARMRLASTVRQEVSEFHRQSEALRAAEEERNRELAAKVREETSEAALRASWDVSRKERVDAVAEVKAAKQQGEEMIKTNRDKTREERVSMKRAVNDAKSGGKQARSTLSARRLVDAEDVRKRAADLKDQRVKQLVTTHRKKKQSRDAILTARAVDPKAMASGGGGTDRNGGGGGAMTPPGMRSGSKPQTPPGGSRMR